jgi:hypothetical protein
MKKRGGEGEKVEVAMTSRETPFLVAFFAIATQLSKKKRVVLKVEFWIVGFLYSRTLNFNFRKV